LTGSKGNDALRAVAAGKHPSAATTCLVFDQSACHLSAGTGIVSANAKFEAQIERNKKRAKRGRSDLFLSNLIPMFRWLVFSANFSFREARPASIAPWIVRAAQTCRAGRNHCRNEETIGTLLVVTRHYYCGAYSCFSFLIFLPL